MVQMKHYCYHMSNCLGVYYNSQIGLVFNTYINYFREVCFWKDNVKSSVTPQRTITGVVSVFHLFVMVLPRTNLGYTEKNLRAKCSYGNLRAIWTVP